MSQSSELVVTMGIESFRVFSLVVPLAYIFRL